MKYAGWLMIGFAVAMAGCSKPSEETSTIDTRPLVRTQRIDLAREFIEGANVQGTVRTKYSALVAARVPGTIDTIFVDEGATVTAGTPMFQIDQVNLSNAVRAAEDDLAMAQANGAQAEASFEKASVDAGRMAALFETQAVTQDVREKYDLQLKVATAARGAAAAKITKAETGLAIAKKNLKDSHGLAPFDGIITRKLKDAGDFVGAGTPIFAMDNPATYEVCFAMNAEQYDRVTVGETMVRLRNGSQYPVTYKSPSVHPVTRTFEIRITVPKTPSLAAGMIRDALVIFRQFTARAVPTSAVGLRGGTNVVFIVAQDTVASVPVETGATWDGWREIRAGALDDQAAIVVEGMLLLNPGDRVRTLEK